MAGLFIPKFFLGTFGGMSDGALAEIADSIRGSGSSPVTLAFYFDPPINTRPIADADVWLTTDAAGKQVVAGTIQTNSEGKATFMLDSGATYRAWLQKDGVNPIRGEPFTAVAD